MRIIAGLIVLAMAATAGKADVPATQPSGAVARAQARIDQLEQALIKLRSENDEQEQQIRQSSGRLNVEPERIRTAVGNWDDEIDKLQIEIDATKAKMQAIDAAVDRIGREAERLAYQTPLTEQMRALIQARAEMLDHLDQAQKNGAAAKQDVAQAQAALAEAKAQAAEQQAKAVAANGGDTVAAMQKELVQTQIDLTELVARLDAILERRAALKTVMPQLDELEHRLQEMNDVEAVLKQRQMDLIQMDRNRQQ